MSTRFSRRVLATLLTAVIAAGGCSIGDKMEGVEDQMEGLGPANPLPLESAAGVGDVDAVERLLASGVDPNDGVYSSPLMAVVDDREPSAVAGEVAQILLDNGAEVDFGGMSRSDQTPLHRAAMRDSAELVVLLLAAGADPCRTVSNPSELRGMTAIDIAVDNGSAAAARELEEASSTCS